MSGVDAVVVAAGASTRMGGVDKLGLLVHGRPLLAWTLAAVAAAPVVRTIVVVTAAGRVAEVAAAPWLPSKVVGVVEGGSRRQDSVAAGIAALAEGSPSDVVLVHDGARPLVSPELVARVAAAAAEHGAAIPVVPVAETIKAAQRQLKARRPEIEADLRKTEKERGKLLAERANLVEAVGKGKAKSLLAHRIGRAVYYMLQQGKVFDLAKFLTT